MHRYKRGYLWVSNQFTSSWVGKKTQGVSENSRPGRVLNLGPQELIVKRFTTTLPLHAQ